MTVFPAFYPVVPSVQSLRQMLQGGARLVQLRIKSTDDQVLTQAIIDSIAACKAAGAQLVVNDHWQLALDLGADYVHLGQEDLDTCDRQALLKRGVRLGISTHDRAELERALSLSPDYVALGPIWPTTLKVMPWAPQGTAKLSEWKGLIGARPLVAIGGITLEKARECFASGADCVAVVNDVVNVADPVSRAATWQREVSSHAASRIDPPGAYA